MQVEKCILKGEKVNLKVVLINILGYLILNLSVEHIMQCS